eukprot:366028-Chlamydomonas_euryale.AAC.7
MQDSAPAMPGRATVGRRLLDYRATYMAASHLVQGAAPQTCLGKLFFTELRLFLRILLTLSMLV